jgi:hypothetical protein
MQDRREGLVPAELVALATQAAAVLAPHEQRVVQEATELQGRLDKLTAFIGGQVFVTELDQTDRLLLYRQHAAMTELVFVLAARIQRFKPVGADSEGGEV